MSDKELIEKCLLTREEIQEAILAGDYEGRFYRVGEAQLTKAIPIVAEEIKGGWELQDTLLELTVLNQNAPKIILTNDECGWNISYFPDPPFTEGEISTMKGDPLEAVRALKKLLGSTSLKDTELRHD